MQSYRFNKETYNKLQNSLTENDLTQDILYKMVKKSYNLEKYDAEIFLKTLSKDMNEEESELMKQTFKLIGKMVVLKIFKQDSNFDKDKIINRQVEIDKLFLYIKEHR